MPKSAFLETYTQLISAQAGYLLIMQRFGKLPSKESGNGSIPNADSSILVLDSGLGIHSSKEAILCTEQVQSI